MEELDRDPLSAEPRQDQVNHVGLQITMAYAKRTGSPICIRSTRTDAGGLDVEFRVTTPRSGYIVVHGTLNPQPVAADHPTTVAFRALYSGRHALHFHGDDASHIELMALNVMPARMQH